MLLGDAHALMSQENGDITRSIGTPPRSNRKQSFGYDPPGGRVAVDKRALDDPIKTFHDDKERRDREQWEQRQKAEALQARPGCRAGWPV